MAASEEAAAAARSAAQQALGIEGRITAAHDSATRAEDAAAWAEQMKVQIQQRIDDAGRRIDEALVSGRQMLQSMAGQAEALKTQAAVPAEPALGGGAQQVLERLEADYQLLTRLVQELHGRIGTLAMPPATPATPATPEAPAMVEPPAPAVATEPVASVEVPVASMEPPVAPEPEMAPLPVVAAQESWQEPATAEEPVMAAAPVEEPKAEPVPAGEALMGRIMVKVAPVPDFDRLLSLDGAFGRMSGVRNVTLADYAQEEVTFRIELETELTVSQLAQRLSDGAGRGVEVVSSSNENVSLRLVA